MASTEQKTASTHRSAVVRGTHEFHIVGFSGRTRFAGVATSTSIRSGNFLAGGHTWTLSCSFDDDQGHLAAITLEFLGTAKDVVATAGIRIEDPLGETPPAVWRSVDANRFQPTNSGRSWELSVPEAYHGHETSYVRDDRLTVQCTVDVLQESPPDVVETRNCFVSVVPPPTISQDLHKLLHVDMLGSSETEDRRRRCMQPDVTFVVEETEIGAHKLVLALRSPVFDAEFRWHRNQSATIRTRLSIDDMSASTFRAMIRFIYTDELPIKASNGTTRRARRREAMARDLLAAADRYDLQRLRLMCQNILLEGIDTSSVMGTLLLVRGRQTCRQLEDSCIEYIASDPEVLDAVMATDEYQELKNSCSPMIIEIMERVATHNGARKSASSDGIIGHRRLPEKSWSTYNTSEKVHGVHEFRIPNFCAVQSRLGGQPIHSGTFRVGDYDWALEVYWPAENISVYLRLLSRPPGQGVKVYQKFMIEDPSGKYPMIVKQDENCPSNYTNNWGVWGYDTFITLESAKSRYLAHDGSLTICCDIAVTKQHYSRSTSTPTTRAAINVPSSTIALQLEQLLVSEEGSDVRFLVEGSEILAHGLVIAARSPMLHEAVTAAGNNKDGEIIVRIDGMKATVFKVVLRFLYTDELDTLGSTVVDEDMLAAASRFGLERMKIICENFLAEHISQDNAFDTLKAAQRQYCLKLEEYCMDFILSVPPLAKDVMKTILMSAQQHDRTLDRHREGRRGRGRRPDEGPACPVAKKRRR